MPLMFSSKRKMGDFGEESWPLLPVFQHKTVTEAYLTRQIEQVLRFRNDSSSLPSYTIFRSLCSIMVGSLLPTKAVRRINRRQVSSEGEYELGNAYALVQ